MIDQQSLIAWATRNPEAAHAIINGTGIVVLQHYDGIPAHRVEYLDSRNPDKQLSMRVSVDCVRLTRPVR